MKQQLTFSAILLLAISLQAQEEKPVVIVNTKGQVELIPQNGGAGMELQSGAVAKNTGQLKLAKRAKAVLYCNGQFLNVEGNQTIALSTICGAEGGRRSLNFDYNFGNKMMAAVEMVAVAKHNGDGWSNAVADPKKGGDGWGTAVADPKKGGDGWGTSVADPKKGGDGWGGKGANITLIMPFGKLTGTPTTFFWSKPAGINTYQLAILDKGKTIHTVSTSDTFVQINLRAIKLEIGKKYQWKVTTSGEHPMVSNELEIAIGNKSEQMTSLSNAKTSSLASGKNHLRGLTEAIALEDGEWFYDAQKKYEALQKKQTDSVVRMMHAAFWMRRGFVLLAQKAAKGGA